MALIKMSRSSDWLREEELGTRLPLLSRQAPIGGQVISPLPLLGTSNRLGQRHFLFELLVDTHLSLTPGNARRRNERAVEWRLQSRLMFL